MPAGTIALTNGSTAVTGTGTSFTSELKAGDFVYVTVGGAPYTLVASAIGSDTQLTLAVAFDGPTTSGLAWNAVPASLQVAITQKILNDFASVARGRILDFQNWQKIYSSDASVTVTRPDRTQFTGPSWGYMATQFGDKANTSDVLTKADNLGSLADKAVARTNLGFVDGALPLTLGGTGGKTLSGAQSSLGIKPDAFSPSDNTTSWITPTGANGWSVGSTVVRTGYRKVMGKVQLSLNMTANGAKADGTTMFTLPAGYIPTTIISVSSAISDLTTANRAEIQPDGRVVCQGYNGSQRNLRLYIEYPVEI